jgi:hypothetical protein
VKILSCVSWVLSVVAFLLTLAFTVGKIGHVGTMGDWSWEQVLLPIGCYVFWVLFWFVIGLASVFSQIRANRVRDPHRSFEPLRRLRAWRWRKTQEKYDLDKEKP